jgi:hypothetical protein
MKHGSNGPRGDRLRRAGEFVSNYPERASSFPTPEQVEALYRRVMRRVFGKEKD